ncbi:MAG: NAD(+) synthase [Eubacteriales bacterium]
MKHGFVKVAAVTPTIKVADVVYNTEQICKGMTEVWEQGVKIAVFPELCLTGYTCGDLFTHDLLLRRVRESIADLVVHSRTMDTLFFIGAPLSITGKLYNVAVAINQGEILGLVTKTFLPNYGEFYEMRQYTKGPRFVEKIEFLGQSVLFGPNILFQSDAMEELIVSAEICEDVWAATPPSVRAAVHGATIIVNCSASTEGVGKSEYRNSLISGQSARLIAGYVYANAGEGESTTDVVFGGHNIIAENGTVLAEAKRFVNETIYSEIDVQRLVSERRKNTTFQLEEDMELPKVTFHTEKTDTLLTRAFARTPFVPSNEEKKARHCEEILSIQAMGLKKRLAHIGCKSAVVGISGGLDSTLALLVTVRAFDLLGMDRSCVTAVTMPCFGTTDRTYQNACNLTRELGATLREVDIKDAVRMHFRDIKHDESLHNVTYENGQARERTQVLMDIANQTNGIVIGTGDMSELALGWATYNGDHMSMYGVNASVPKTLVRHLVRYEADICDSKSIREILLDVLDTPVSPELLPPKNGVIAQITEDLVGPYELHDYFLYFILRFGYEPKKIYRLAIATFEGVYDAEYIKKWLRTFYWRFFSQQFKRSCLPDGPKVGSVAVSPRGDLRMPSDASARLWVSELESL